MGAATKLKLGVLAESSRQLKRLASLVQKSEHELVSTILTGSVPNGQLDVEQLARPDAWVACMEHHSEFAETIIHNLDLANIPVMFDDPESVRRGQEEDIKRRFSSKVEACLADNSMTNGTVAKSLWVLAASTGGPEAVVEFLSEIPRELNGIALLYVQHINKEMLPSLMRTLRNRCCLDVHLVERSGLAVENSLYVISPANKLEFSDRGALLLTNYPWAGDYAPSANQVMAKVAKHYGTAAGAIVFSGMGDDGAESARLMRHAGSQVWVQSPESCTIDSMPVTVLATGTVSFKGTPKELARHFLSEVVNAPHSVSKRQGKLLVQKMI